MSPDDADAWPALSRRAFVGGALAAPAALWLVSCGDSEPDGGQGGADAGGAPSATAADLRDWDVVRALFDLDPEIQHLSAYILASHPRPVRAAIERHRLGLDRDPDGYHRANERPLIAAVGRAAAAHIGAKAGQIALTDSTTMGLAVLIGGMRFAPGDEILTTEHEHFAASEAVRLAAERGGALVRKVALYPPAAPERATTDGIVAAIRAGIGPATRLVVVTWVHSSSGVRLPLAEIAEVVARANAGRAVEERALLVVDGVHGLGAGPTSVADLGCDGFAAGCHKWLAGPRGTGIAWARPELWERCAPIVPSFDDRLYGAWIDGEVGSAPPGPTFTPGGFHSFEHRWALKEAFELYAAIGAERIERRIGELSAALREGLAAARGVRVHAPAERRLRSGVITFTVAGMRPERVVARLAESDGVSATVTPYAVPLARLGTSWVNSEAEVEAAIAAVRAL